MISRSLSLGLEDDERKKLEDEAASSLQFAHVEDFLLPETDAELKVMERIFSLHVSSKHKEFNTRPSPLNTSSMVAELWDRYLTRVAVHPPPDTAVFITLIQIIPATDRETHDHLYRAISTFFREHPNLSSEEKAAMCRYLDCQKLSQPVCIQAVQNESMPLRLIVQALSVQQMQTHQAFKDLSESFREMHVRDFSSYLSSRTHAPQSPYQQGCASTSTGKLINQDHPQELSELNKEDFESASFRIRDLEEELVKLKRSLDRHNMFKASNLWVFGVDESSEVKRSSSSDRFSSCMSSIRWSSQRRNANIVLKVFRRIRMLGKGRRKKQQVVGRTKSRFPHHKEGF